MIQNISLKFRIFSDILFHKVYVTKIKLCHGFGAKLTTYGIYYS